MYIYFSIMLKGKSKTSTSDVIPAIANFIGEAYFQEDIQDLPNDMLEIFELFLETEQANCQLIRSKMLRCLKTARTLDKTLAVFTKEQVIEACEKLNYN